MSYLDQITVGSTTYDIQDSNAQRKTITGTSAPTTSTVGTVGLIYINTSATAPPYQYVCTAVSGSTYTWKPIGETNEVLYFTGITCSATTGNFVQYVNSAITSNHVLVYLTFANPAAIASNVTWTTSGSNQWLRLNGTCTSTTTCDVVLIKKNN